MAAGPGLGKCAAAMDPGSGLHDGQAQAGSPGIAHTGFVQADKALEHAFRIGCRDTLPVIVDPQDGLLALDAEGHRDSRCAVATRVAEQVVDCAPQGPLITANEAVIDRNPELNGRIGYRGGAHGIGDDGDEVDFSKCLRALRIGAGKGQEVFDELLQATQFAQGEGLLLPLRVVELQRHAQGGERIAQLVPGIRDELARGSRLGVEPREEVIESLAEPLDLIAGRLHDEQSVACRAHALGLPPQSLDGPQGPAHGEPDGNGNTQHYERQGDQHHAHDVVHRPVDGIQRGRPAHEYRAADSRHLACDRHMRGISRTGVQARRHGLAARQDCTRCRILHDDVDASTGLGLFREQDGTRRLRCLGQRITDVVHAGHGNFLDGSPCHSPHQEGGRQAKDRGNGDGGRDGREHGTTAYPSGPDAHACLSR